MNNHDEPLSPTTEHEADESGLTLFKTQFQDAARDLCLMLRKRRLKAYLTRLCQIRLYVDLPETHFSNSRIYDAQVVEIRDDLSLIILMSTADEVNVLSTPSSMNPRNSISGDCLTPFIYLPVYIFEVCMYFLVRSSDHN